MNLRILMAGNDEAYLCADQQMLHDRGFIVYKTLAANNLDELAEEIRPDLVFLNYQKPADMEMALYHEVLDDLKIAGIPVIFTLSEDDVYLVTRKRTTSRDKRNIVADSVINAIKMAFTETKNIASPRVPVDLKRPAMHYPYFPARA